VSASLDVHPLRKGGPLEFREVAEQLETAYRRELTWLRKHGLNSYSGC
jgi:hypothetical protein